MDLAYRERASNTLSFSSFLNDHSKNISHIFSGGIKKRDKDIDKETHSIIIETSEKISGIDNKILKISERKSIEEVFQSLKDTIDLVKEEEENNTKHISEISDLLDKNNSIIENIIDLKNTIMIEENKINNVLKRNKENEEIIKRKKSLCLKKNSLESNNVSLQENLKLLEETMKELKKVNINIIPNVYKIYSSYLEKEKQKKIDKEQTNEIDDERNVKMLCFSILGLFLTFIAMFLIHFFNIFYSVTI